MRPLVFPDPIAGRARVLGLFLTFGAPLDPLRALAAEFLACGYLNVETFNKTGEAGAIVTGVGDFEDMLGARVTAVSEAALSVGVKPGMTGQEAIEKLR